MHTSRTYNKYPENIPFGGELAKTCNCNVTSIQYLCEVVTGITWCSSCKIIYEKLPGPDQVITVYCDAEHQYDKHGTGVIVWDSGKSGGTVSKNALPGVHVVDPFFRITTEIVTVPKSDRKLYEEAYWNFVNAKTYDDAMYWKNQMESKVDLALEPDGDNWVSWVKDPEVREEIKKRHADPFYVLSALIFACFGIIQLLQITGIIH